MIVYLPPWTGDWLDWLLVGWFVLGPVIYLCERLDCVHFGYSKFARGRQGGLPSKLGMRILYSTCVVLYPLLAFWVWKEPSTDFSGSTSLYHVGCLLLVVGHFVKRCFETLFLHNYSGLMNWEVIYLGPVGYGSVVAFLAYVATKEVTEDLLVAQSPGLFQPMYITGAVVFVIGETIDFEHHAILARLRKGGDKNNDSIDVNSSGKGGYYKLPTDRLFRYCARPHYLGESIAWLGIAIWFCHVAAWVVWLTLTFYLAGRSHQTLIWYQSKFIEDAPKDWNAIIPFVY